MTDDKKNREKALELYRTASRLKSSGQLKAAEALFKTVIRETRDNNLNAGAHFHIGEMAFAAKQMKKARNHFLQCLEFNPTHKKANRYLEQIPLSKKENSMFKMLEEVNIDNPLVEKKLRDIFSKKDYYLLKKHFYLPIPEEEDMSGDFFERCTLMPGVEIDEAKIFRLMEEIFPLYMEEFRKSFPNSRTNDPTRYYLLNASFMAVDAHVYYSLIRQFKPGRIVEIGGGNSSLLAGAAMLRNSKETGTQGNLTVIDPNPNKILSGGFPGLSKLIPVKVQNVPVDFFQTLQENDILFIDSSHVLKAGGDVQYEYLEILPRLKPGVMVHIHDISLPGAYPRVYYDNHVFFNEQYLLQAFLVFNTRVDVLWPGNYMMLKYPAQLKDFFPEIELMRKEFPGSGPASFWLKIK